MYNKKHFKDNKRNSLHLTQKKENAWIFGLCHYLFLKAHSFPQASLSENCFLLGKDYVCEQISKMEANVYILLIENKGA